MAGYSKKSLVQKLGIKEKFGIIIVNPPQDYDKTLGELPNNVVVADSLIRPLDFIHFFTKDRAELAREFPYLKQGLAPNGILWISWPKRTSKVVTDLNENIVREIGLSNGLVDVKVCAVDQVWSGLKFVYRLQDRK